MTRPVAVLRPEPGNAATAARLAAMGLGAIRLPLFAVRPLAWSPPGPDAHDAIVFTSANALRHGGEGLAHYRRLPAFAVGDATAAAARAAGFEVTTGPGDAARLLPLLQARGITRALLVAGRERTVDAGGPISVAVSVYAAEPLPVAPGALHGLSGSVALLHSARAACRLAELVPERRRMRLAAISAACLQAAGEGWETGVAATTPDEAALLALVRRLAD